MAEEFSPEEKLLRLIRGEKKKSDKSVVQNLEGSKNQPETPSPVIPTKKIERATTQVIADEWRYLRFINSALIIILIVTITFFTFDLISPKLQKFVPMFRSEPHIAKDETPSTSREPQDAGREVQTLPFSTYSEVIGKRELFKPLKSEIQAEKPAERKSESAYDKLKDLSLIGIIAGENPQAVIEDKKIQKTYFLYKGQTVNQMKVEEILGDKVILDFDGEKVELTL